MLCATNTHFENLSRAGESDRNFGHVFVPVPNLSRPDDVGFISTLVIVTVPSSSMFHCLHLLNSLLLVFVPSCRVLQLHHFHKLFQLLHCKQLIVRCNATIGNSSLLYITLRVRLGSPRTWMWPKGFLLEQGFRPKDWFGVPYVFCPWGPI